MQVADKVMVVTGGGSGIGRQLVLELLRRGSRVAALDVREDGIRETAELAGVGDRLATFTLDITDRDATAALPDQVADVLGPVDGLVNNAGIIQPFVRIADLDFDTIDRVMDVNFNGTVNMVKAFLPRLLARPVAHIANVASMGAFLPVPGQTVYGASKAAVKLLTEGLYAELLDTNVGVTVILQGSTETSITTNSGVEVPGTGDESRESRLPVMSAEDAAKAIVDGIEHDRLHLYVGLDSQILGVLHRVTPKGSTHLVQRQMKDLLES